jgi:lipopolysaccharide export system permease protein
MQILDRHVLIGFLKFFIGGVTLLTGVAVIANIMESLPRVLNFDGDSRYIWEFYLFRIPNYVMIIVPPAVLFSISMLLGTLQQENELKIMLAAGKSYQRILLPIYCATVIISGLLFFFSEFLSYPLNYRANFAYDIIKGYSQDRLEHGLGRGNYTVKANDMYYYLGGYDPAGGNISNIHILKMNDNGTPNNIIEAAAVKVEKNNWSFSSGTETQFDENGVFVNRFFFEKMELILPETIHYFKRFTKGLESSSIFDLEEFIKIKKVRGESYSEELTELYWHYSYPIVVILVTLIGVIVGASKKKASLSSSISTALLISIVYFFLLYFGKSFGANGQLPEWLAAWMANILFSGFAAVGMSRINL